MNSSGSINSPSAKRAPEGVTEEQDAKRARDTPDVYAVIWSIKDDDEEELEAWCPASSAADARSKLAVLHKELRACADARGDVEGLRYIISHPDGKAYCIEGDKEEPYCLCKSSSSEKEQLVIDYRKFPWTKAGSIRYTADIFESSIAYAAGGVDDITGKRMWREIKKWDADDFKTLREIYKGSGDYIRVPTDRELESDGDESEFKNSDAEEEDDDGDDDEEAEDE